MIPFVPDIEPFVPAVNVILKLENPIMNKDPIDGHLGWKTPTERDLLGV